MSNPGKSRTSKRVGADPSAESITSPIPEPEPSVARDEGSAEAFARFEAEARALPADSLITLDVDPHLARHNALRGAAAVLARRDAVVASGLSVDWKAIDNLDALGLALLWATAETVGVTPATVLPTLRLGRALRRKMLKAVDALVEWKHVAASEFKDILRGKGQVDTARDLLSLARLFRRDATKLAGLHPVDEASIAEAERVGTELLRLLKPAGTKRTAAVKSLVDNRMVDRMYTLLHNAYAQVEQAAGVIWKREAAKQVPSLRTRAKRSKTAKVVVPVVAPGTKG